MRVVISIQSKRSSSRGLVHYVAHSKIDPAKEPASGRELFNRFGDSLGIRSANNYLKVDISRRRPSNEELHHLVLSFRAEDFAKFGPGEKERRRAAKRITRSALARLEESLHADKLGWAAAVHLNTDNPHVHIAIQKQYFTKDLERKTLTKIPREAIPHYEKTPDGTKRLSPGFLIDAASEKMEEIIRQNESRGKRRTGKNNRAGKRTSTTEEQVLAQSLLQKFALRACMDKLEALTSHGNKMRFRVYDDVAGAKRRMSLDDIDHRAGVRADAEIRRNDVIDSGTVDGWKKGHFDSQLENGSSAERQIRTILFKLTAKEETKRQELARKFKASEQQVNAIRAACRKEDRKLPTPALTKTELDHLQEQCLEADDIRSFAYLERVRTELSVSGEIDPRDIHDVQRLSALKLIHSLRSDLSKKHLSESQGRRFIRSVDLNGTRWKLSELEERAAQFTRGSNVLERLGLIAKPRGDESVQRDREALRKQIIDKLDVEDRQAITHQQREEKKVKILDEVLRSARSAPGFIPTDAVFDSYQLAEIESLSFRLQNAAVYEQGWEMQKVLIERAGETSRKGGNIFKTHPRVEAEKIFADEKSKVIAGRALAREIVSRVQLSEAKSNLKRFSRAKPFHKFEIVNENSGTREFVSLKDVEIVRSGSFLNQAVDFLSESRERRNTRSAVRKEIKQKEKNLKAEVTAARQIFNIATEAATEHKPSGFFGLTSLPVQEPHFTTFELSMTERRISQSTDGKEVRKLEKILDGTRENAVDSLAGLLAGFEDFRGQADEGRKRKAQTGDGRESRPEHGPVSEGGLPAPTDANERFRELSSRRNKLHDPPAVLR